MQAAFMSVLCVLMAGASTDESWRLPLVEKEKAIERNIVARHNILGLYPSQVEVPLDGGPVDTSTRGYANIAHAVCWTANYLAGASYRYAYLKKSGAPEEEVDQARRRADDLFEAVYRCQLVTGVRGLQARGYAIGHGESYEEREDVPTRDVWYQGAGECKDLRWRGDPSHHNYSDASHGLMQYYDLAAEGGQKERARDAIRDLVGYWVDNDLNIVHLDGKHKTRILGWTDGKTPNTRIMMAIAQAKYGHYVTGEERFRTMYDRLIGQYHIRGMQQFEAEKDFDDAEHVFCHLENLFRIEKDPELLAAYRVVADALWANHKDDAQSLFTYIYFAIAPEAPGKEKALGEAVYSLQTWPTDMTLRPRMSSLREDLKPPYPVYAAAWDNEYIWKGNLLQPDGWLSRAVTDVAVSAEDPMVIYAIDESGGVYQSRDGAATAAQWYPVDDGLRGARARQVFAGSRARLAGVVCDDGAYVSTTGGATWLRLTDPLPGVKPVALQFDAGNPQALYLITEKGTFKADEDRRRKFGETWREVDEPLSLAPHVSSYAGAETKPVADPKRSSILYKAGERQGVLKSEDGGRSWKASVTGLVIPFVRTVVVSPHTDWVFAGTPAGLFLSKDGGVTWEDGHLVLQFKKNTRIELGGAAFIDAFWRARYYGFIDEAASRAPYTAER